MLKNKIMYLIMLVALVLFYIGFDDKLSFIILLTAIIIPVLMLISLRRAGAGLSAKLTKLKLAQAKNSDIPVGAIIRNTSSFPLSNAVVTFEYMNTLDSVPHELSTVIPIQANNSQEIRLSLSSQYCGKLIVRLKNVVYYDYLRIFSQRLDVNEESETIITPQIHVLDAAVDHSIEPDIESDVFSKVKSGDDCSEVFAVKDYVPGDKVNRIHWKLSTKQDKLMVKQYSLPIKSSVLILLEFFADKNDKSYMEKLDALVETTLSLSDILTQNEIIHTISWYNKRKSKFCSNIIKDENDIGIFLGQLFKTGCYSDLPHAYMHHDAVNENKAFSHILYVASNPSAEILGTFSMLRNAAKKTVFNVVCKDEMPENLAFDSELNIIPVVAGNISGSVSELVV